jgi:hypothetical protein
MRAGFESLHDKLDAIIRRLDQKIEPLLASTNAGYRMSNAGSGSSAKLDSPAPVQVY